MKISLWSSGKNIENFSYEKVNEKWKFRKNYKRFSYKKVWVCLLGICDFAEVPAIFRGTIRLLRSVDFCHEGSAISKILSDSLLWGVRTLMQMPSPGVNSPFRVYKSLFEPGLLCGIWGCSRVQDNRGLLGTQKTLVKDRLCRIPLRETALDGIRGRRRR